MLSFRSKLLATIASGIFCLLFMLPAEKANSGNRNSFSVSSSLLDRKIKLLKESYLEKKEIFLRDAKRLGLEVEGDSSDKNPQLLVAERLPSKKLKKQPHVLMRNYARDLYLLSRKVQAAGRPSFAFKLIREVLKYDPDHIKARSLLGFVQYKTEWVTPFEREKLRARQVDHPQFGWLPATHVARYEKGERYFNGQWVSSARESEIRSDFSNAWKIRTEHFLIVTNHSLERGVDLGRALEDFHWFFRNVFVAFYSEPNQTQKLFDNGGAKFRPESDLYEVHFFRTQEEYVAQLVRKVPMIAYTNGLYRHADHVSYFYDHPKLNSNGTLFHEATHQLMHESSRKLRDVGVKEHFWATEGIACYMESFLRGEKSLSVGDPRHARLYAARHHLIEDRYQIPLLNLARQGQERFQKEASIEDLQKKYAQGAGLSHFLLHKNDGEYRDAYLFHLSQIYSTRDAIRARPKTLDELTGHSYPELDLQYREYIKELHERNPQRMKLVPNDEAK